MSVLPGPEAVDAFLERLVVQDAALLEADAAPAREGLPAIQVSALQGALLGLLTAAAGARRALEIGTLAGYSTIWLARALRGPGAYLLSLEIDAHHAAVARRSLARAGVADVAEVRVGPAADSLRALVAERVEPFDVVFIDADKPSNVGYLEAALALTRPGSLIVVDNVVRAGAVADPRAADPSAVGSRALVERVAREPRLAATAIQTVGRKGHDGLLIARVVEPAP